MKLGKCIKNTFELEISILRIFQKPNNLYLLTTGKCILMSGLV
jgi:hypothetical protein